MNDPTTSTPTSDVPTPEDHNPQAQLQAAQDSPSTDAPETSGDAALSELADGETRDTQLCFLKINALLMLDRDIHANVPDDIKQGVKRYFEEHGFVLFVELPDKVVKLHVTGDLGEWDGTSVRYRVDVQDQEQGETYQVSMLFTAQLDPHAPLDPGLQRRLDEKLQEATANDANDANDADDDSGSDPDSAPTIPSTPAPDLS